MPFHETHFSLYIFSLVTFSGANHRLEIVRNLCENTTCPTDTARATEENCCVWHANIHTCHPSITEVRLSPWRWTHSHVWEPFIVLKLLF